MAQLKFKLDPAGFPMVWVDSISAYMHWIPVTKIQFEYFLCASPDSYFDTRWYDNLLLLNPRVTPGKISLDNYWNAFLTGIKPNEAKHFAKWCGSDYTLPTLSEWFKAYNAFKAIPPPDSSEIIKSMGALRERVKTLLTRVAPDSHKVENSYQKYYKKTMADLMLMRMGVMEWVECENMQWGGMGQTLPSFFPQLFAPDSGYPSLPPNPEGNRLYPYGFRLVRRSA